MIYQKLEDKIKWIEENELDVRNRYLELLHLETVFPEDDVEVFKLIAKAKSKLLRDVLENKVLVDRESIYNHTEWLDKRNTGLDILDSIESAHFSIVVSMKRAPQIDDEAFKEIIFSKLVESIEELK